MPNRIILQNVIRTRIKILRRIKYPTIGIHLQKVHIPFLIHPQIDPPIANPTHPHKNPPRNIF